MIMGATNGGLFPIAPLIRGLVVDDHFALSIGPPHHARHALVASSFDQAIPFYTQAGLVTSEKKSRRNDSNGAVIGAHIDGDLGIVSADRAKLWYLCDLTWKIVQNPQVNGRTLRQLLAHWNFCLLSRRPMLSLLQYSYKDLPDVVEDDTVFMLAPHTRQELGMLCVLTPCMFSNLSARFSESLECTDASEN